MRKQHPDRDVTGCRHGTAIGLDLGIELGISLGRAEPADYDAAGSAPVTETERA